MVGKKNGEGEGSVVSSEGGEIENGYSMSQEGSKNGANLQGSEFERIVDAPRCMGDIDMTKNGPTLQGRVMREHCSDFIAFNQQGDIIIPEVIRVEDEEKSQLPRFPSCPGLGAGKVELQRPKVGDQLRRHFPGWARVYSQVRASAIPNYRGARIPLESGLNIEAWRKRAHLISDGSLIDMLQYGFPVGFEGKIKPKDDLPNHGSAVKFPKDIHKFLDKECRLKAMIGPFKQAPFLGWDRVNPLMSRPKRDSVERRVILDLSYPEGQSVNSSIPGNKLDHAEFKMRLPNPWDLAKGIMAVGRGAHLYKVDLSRAYRQLRTCPLDWPLLTVRWDGETYVDTAVPFGLRHGALACQRTTEAVSEIVAAEVGASTHPYIDDTSGVAEPVTADRHYAHLLECMSDLGLDAALSKCTPPATRMCWIGVIFDSIIMTMEIEGGRIEEALEWCEKMMGVGLVSKREFQRFIGKVVYASKCTHGARVFTSRLLDFMCSLETGPAPISEQARADITWFMAYLKRFNGVTMIRPQTASQVICVDACPKGGEGVWWGREIYGFDMPGHIRELGLSIGSLECWNLLVAVRMWSEGWRGETVLIFTDNWSTACALESGRAEDPVIRGALREI